MKTLLVVAVLAGAAAAEEPAAVDVSAIRDRLTVWTDGKQHFMALVLTSKLDSPTFWSHDGRSFYQLRRTSGSSDGNDDDLKRLGRSFWEPRGHGFSAEAGFDYTRETKQLIVQCAARNTPMEKLDAEAAKKLLSAARFSEPRWARYAYALARDNAGKYYYVDNLSQPPGAKNFRLFAGPRGALKLQKMINVVSDSAGDIFSTTSGDLRLVLSKQDSSWIVHEKQTKLVWLSVDDNRALIYNDLGVYSGVALGTPCDDL